MTLHLSFKKWESIQDEVSNGLLTTAEVDSALQEVLGPNIKAGLDFEQFQKVMDLLEEVMAAKEDFDSDDDEEDDDSGGGGKVAATKEAPPAVPSVTKKAAVVKSTSAPATFVTGQGFGRAVEAPPKKGKQ